jgi:hypothetical protein
MGLINRLGRRIRKVILIGTTLVTLGSALGCDLCGPSPEPPIPEPTSEDTPASQYDPTLDLSLITEPEKNFYEEEQAVITLPIPQDPNPEDNPVPYIGVHSLDGKTTPSLDGNQLTIIGNKDKTGTYQLELEFGTATGGVSTKTLEGMITNLSDISGTLESNEDDGVGKSGIIKVYTADKAFIDNIYVSSSGEFDFQLNQILSEIVLQARLGSSPNYEESYIRTIKLNGIDDHSGLKVRVVPYVGETSIDFDGNGLTQQEIIDFKTFMNEINFGYIYLGGGESINDGLYKWNFGEFSDIPEHFEGIEILYDDPLGRGSFTLFDQNFIEAKINGLNDIRAFIESRELYVQKDSLSTLEEDKHYDNINNALLMPHQNWIIIIPNSKITYGGETEPYDTDDNGYLNRISISIKTLSDAVLTHEFGHAFIAQDGDAYKISGEYSIMSYNTPSLAYPGLADKKAAKIVHENTYRGGESSDNILGTEFWPE